MPSKECRSKSMPSDAGQKHIYGTRSEYLTSASLVESIVHNAVLKREINGYTYDDVASELRCSKSHAWDILNSEVSPNYHDIVRLLRWLAE